MKGAQEYPASPQKYKNNLYYFKNSKTCKKINKHHIALKKKNHSNTTKAQLIIIIPNGCNNYAIDKLIPYQNYC